ncbi:MAG: phage tail protein, partial [Proteobacteria bacterium]|nr:phage tail protein [Pseudomonadota bacterium]
VASRRLTGGSNRGVHSDLAVVTDDAAMARRADIWLQDLWAGRENATFALGPQCLSLTPGDVIAVTINARRRLFEIDATVDAEARQVAARSIDPEVFSVPLLAPRLKAPAIPASLGPVQAVVLDLPAIDSSSPPILTRLAMSANPWPASIVIWTSPDGSSFQATAIVAAPSMIGETLDPLPSGPSGRWDYANRFRIRLYRGAPASVSDARVLGGANAAAIQNPDGDWEILQFANAVLVDDNTYLLSRLLRGQAGSEYAIAGSLPAGATFVLLDTHLVPVARGLDALDRPVLMRLAAVGRNHDDPTAVALTVTPQATALLPLSPVHVKARRDSDGIHISWIRRTRIDGDGWGIEVPLGEDVEAYALDILSGGSIVRSISCSSSEALYANADELADFGSVQTSLHLRVAQLSATVGAGHASELTLTI